MPLQAFSEERLDLGLLYGTDGGILFATTITVTSGGQEQRFPKWETEAGRWELGNRTVTSATLHYLMNFFRARRGRAVGFRWKNWADYVLATTQIGTGDAAEVDFQIIQQVTPTDGDTYTRNITKPVGGTLTVYLDAVPQGSGWTLDTATGIITFSAPPGAGVAVSAQCEYDTPVRFDVDFLPTRFEAWRESDGEIAYSLPTLPIVRDPNA